MSHKMYFTVHVKVMEKNGKFESVRITRIFFREHVDLLSHIDLYF